MSARQLFLPNAAMGRIRLTRTALTRYRERCPKAGFDIHGITTMAQLAAAVDARFAQEMAAPARETRDTDPLVDAIPAGLPGWD